MMMASLMAGLAFSNASLGLVHAMAHSLGGLKNLPHGECNALLLEKVIQYNFLAAEEKYALLAETQGLSLKDLPEDERAGALAEKIAELRRKLGIVQRLGEMGVAMEDLPGLAGFAYNDPCLATNPCEAGPAEIEAIYRQIYE
jgi:alcohol dehydrogenase class IV